MADDPQTFDELAPDLSVLADSEVKAKSDAWGLGGEMPWLLRTFGKGVLLFFGIVLRICTRLASKLFGALQLVLEQDNPELGRLASSVLGTMFGTDVAVNIPGSILNPGNLDAAAPAVGAAVLQAVFGALSLDGGGSIEPGVERAETYLGAITELTVRGFLLDALEEVVPHWHLQFIHNLEHELIAGLGLGRIARTVVRPIVQTLVTDPATWALHLSYRPKLLSEATACRLWLTGQWTSAQLDDELGRQGYSSDKIDALVSEHVKRLSVGELVTLVDHQLVDEADALTRINHLGYDTAGAADVWAAARLARLHGYLEKAAAVWLDKYASGLITRDVFVTSIRELGLPDDVAQAIINVGGAHVETPRRLLSYGELKDAWNKNLLTQNEVHEYLVRLGYAEDDATTLVLLNLVTIRDKTEADQAKKDAAAARAAALAKQKADSAAAAAAAKATAAQDRLAKANALAAQKAKVTTDKIALQQFAAAAAEQKAALVNSQHQAGAISTDAATLARAQIDADLQVLLASIAGQAAESKATFDRQLLELHQADRAAAVQQQFDDIALQLEADQATRRATVDARLQTVADVLAQKLSDIDDLYAARGASIDQDAIDSAAAIDVAVLPSAGERAAAAQEKIAALDAERDRKRTDLAAEFVQRRQGNDDNLANGLIKQTAHDIKVTSLQLAQDQAARLIDQQHDLSVARYQAIANDAVALATAAADAQRTKLALQVEASRETLAADKLTATLAAQHAADVETIALRSIANQVAPITLATAERRRQKVQAAAAAAARQDDITAAEIAKGEQAAQDALSKAQATVQAAKQRLALAQAATPARESAQAAATAALTTLQTTLDGQRLALEARLAVDQAGINPDASAAA
jgi:hypothetical protein